jgi:preprotein translocase SecE subunit
MGFAQYLKDTRAELHHVAWPTRAQTAIFTALVVGISVFISLYLGLFDYVFTSGLGTALEFLPSGDSTIQLQDAPIQIQEEPASSSSLPLIPSDSN